MVLMIVSLKLKHSRSGTKMKTFIAFVSELYQNEIKPGQKLQGSFLGIKPHPDSKHIGTLENGDKVHHRAVVHSSGKEHHYFVSGNSGKTNIHLTTWQKKGHKAEEIGKLNANKSSKGAHNLYQHLVTRHDKILTADDQSEGARKVWQKASKHPQINVHGHTGRKAIHASPEEDEHYVKKGEIHKHQLDTMRASGKDIKKHMADIKDLEKTRETKLVMHKK